MSLVLAGGVIGDKISYRRIIEAAVHRSLMNQTITLLGSVSCQPRRSIQPNASRFTRQGVVIFEETLINMEQSSTMVLYVHGKTRIKN